MVDEIEGSGKRCLVQARKEERRWRRGGLMELVDVG